jgi:hypothetical protein
MLATVLELKGTDKQGNGDVETGFETVACAVYPSFESGEICVSKRNVF